MTFNWKERSMKQSTGGPCDLRFVIRGVNNNLLQLTLETIVICKYILWLSSDFVYLNDKKDIKNVKTVNKRSNQFLRFWYSWEFVGTANYEGRFCNISIIIRLINSKKVISISCKITINELIFLNTKSSLDQGSQTQFHMRATF